MANGLYSNSELVDTLIIDLNNIVKELVSGQYIQACCYVTQMSQKLVNLKKTIDDDLKSKDNVIEDLKRALSMADHEVVGLNSEPPVLAEEKDGVNNGSI